MMQSINFDTGYKTYVINGDKSNVIRVNLADPNIKKRMQEVYAALNDFKASINDTTNTAESIFSLDKLVKEKIDYAFGAGVSKAVFGDMNCTTVVNEEGECIFETFINAFLPILKADIEEAAEHQQKHISDMVDSKKLDKIAARIKGEAQ